MLGWKPDNRRVLLLPHKSKYLKLLETLFLVLTDRNSIIEALQAVVGLGRVPQPWHHWRLGTESPWCGDCPVCGRMLSTVPGFHPVGPVAPSSTQFCQPKNVSKCSQMSVIKQLSASFKSEDHTKLALSKQLAHSVGWCPIPFLPQS